MTEPEHEAMRSGGERARAAGMPTHPQQDGDGSWYDVPCDCDDDEAADTRRTLTAMQTYDAAERNEEPHAFVERLVGLGARWSEAGRDERVEVPLCVVHRRPMVHADDLPSPGHPAGHRWRCMEPGCLSPQPAVEQPHHAAARLRTDEERKALAAMLATGGVVRSGPAIVGEVPR